MFHTQAAHLQYKYFTLRYLYPSTSYRPVVLGGWIRSPSPCLPTRDLWGELVDAGILSSNTRHAHMHVDRNATTVHTPCPPEYSGARASRHPFRSALPVWARAPARPPRSWAISLTPRRRCARPRTRRRARTPWRTYRGRPGTRRARPVSCLRPRRRSARLSRPGPCRAPRPT